MTALPFAPGVAKLTVVQSLQGVSMYNVLHAYRNDNVAWPDNDLSTLASTLRSAWVTNVIPLQSSTVTLTDVIAQDLSNDSGLQHTATGSTAGTGAGLVSPASVAVCWSWKIGLRYRGGHPRTYIGGIPTSSILNANTLVSTAVTAHLNAAAAIRTAINALTVGSATVNLGAVSYYKNKTLRPAPVFLVYISQSVDNRIDSQRRRLGKDRT